MRFAWLLVLVALVAAVGCDAGPTPEKVQAPAQIELLKTALQGMADSGTAGSGVMQVENLLSELRGKDPEKAAALEPGVQELKTLTEPEEIKAKAKELLEKL